MERNKILTFSLAFWLGMCAVHAQTVHLDRFYYQGKEIQVKLDSFTVKDSLVRFIKDRRDTTTVAVKNLDRRNSIYSGTILAGLCRHPGLFHFRVERQSVHNKTIAHIDSFVFVYSSGQAQLTYPSKSVSFLVNQLSQQEAAEARRIRDSLLLWQDSLRTVFNLLRFDSMRVRNRTDTIRYSLDSFYSFLDTMAVKMATEIDSGKIVAFNYIIDFHKGLTLVNWMKDTLLGADTMSLAHHHVRMSRILSQLQEKWKKDLLIRDTRAISSKWKPLLDAAILGDVHKERLLIFPREDNFVTESLLRQFGGRYNTFTSRIWIGFSDATDERLLILVRLVGSKTKRKI